MDNKLEMVNIRVFFAGIHVFYSCFICEKTVGYIQKLIDLKNYNARLWQPCVSRTTNNIFHRNDLCNIVNRTTNLVMPRTASYNKILIYTYNIHMYIALRNNLST